MLKISKILALFIAVGSLTFVGFVVAVTFGGPDWQAELRKPYFAGYTIARSTGENPMWTATRASDGKQILSAKALPPVLVKVMADKRQELSTEIQALNARETALVPRIELLRTALAKDQAALERHESELRARLEQLRQENAALAAQVISGTAEAQKLENTIQSRRDDILRLQQEVEELRADKFRLSQMEVELENQLTQVRGDLKRAEDRAAQLN